MKKEFSSNALWPHGAGVRDFCGKEESHDWHDTREAAKAVCNGLEQEGLGGEGKFFPIITWIGRKKRSGE